MIKKLVFGAIFTVALVLTTSQSAGASAGVKIDKKHFPDKNVRLEAICYDSNEDGYLSPKEAKKVKRIILKDFVQIRNKWFTQGSKTNYYFSKGAKKTNKAQDLKGLQYFTSLKELEIKDYMSDEIDTKYLPKSLKKLDIEYRGKSDTIKVSVPYLKELSINNCSNLKENGVYNQNVTIDVTALKKLEHLGVGEFSNIQGLDNLTNLKSLLVGESCDENDDMQFSNLDLSNNKKLKELYLAGTNITELDLSANKKLEVLHLEYLMLNELDLSNNTKLKDFVLKGNASGVRFEAMYVSETHLQITDIKELDLSMCKNLKDCHIWYDKNLERIILPNENVNLDCGNKKCEVIY